MWKQLFQHAPVPMLVVDTNERIVVVSNKAASLLNTTSAALEGKDADQVLCLSSDEHHKWVPSQDKLLDTRINGARVVFEVSHVHDENLDLQATYLTIVSYFRANVKIYGLTQTTDGTVTNDEEWRFVQNRIIDELPATIIALSKDGKHVYQNAEAHRTLGPIATPSNGIDNWIKQQYEGARNAHGVIMRPNDFPLYKASVSNIAIDSFEIHLGRFIYMVSGRPLYNRRGEHCGGMVFTTDVTEFREEATRKEQMALKQSDVNFREIANNMEQIIWVSNVTQVEFFNTRWFEYTGATLEQSLGNEWNNFVHPDDRAGCANTWAETISSNSDRYISQHRVLGRDGHYRWFLARAIAVRDDYGKVAKWLGTSTDVTQITEALQEAKTAKEQIFNIMQIAHVHYFVVNVDYQMTSAFLASGETRKGLYGRYDVQDVLNRDSRNVLSPDVMNSLKRVLAGQIPSSTVETEVDGLWWQTQFKVMKNAESGSIIGAVGTAMDITEEKIKDQKLVKAALDRKVAEQNSQFKGEFLARMSHEIRTPIGGILGMVQLMKDAFQPDANGSVFHSDVKEAESSEYLDSIKRCGDALLVIINDILDFSKIEVGKLDIENNPFDLHLVVNDVYVAAKHGSAKHAGVDFKLEYNLDKRLIFMGDSNRIRQVLMNLISNALKFTETGSVICRVEQCDDQPAGMKKDTSTTTNRIRFMVIDTGIGISRSALQKLFNPFVQADSTTARKFGGTGLGLSIARQLVILMSGKLDLSSVPAPNTDHGSVATCIIPLVQSSKMALQKTLPAPLVKFLGEHRVLLVEDNKINQVIAQKNLQKLGLKTNLAENGQEALDFLLASEAKDLPDIILMDCQMPLLDGYEATKQIRQLVDQKIRNLPIVAMTASAISGDREKCLLAGMNDYVSKPCAVEDLSRTIRKYLEPQTPVMPINSTPPHVNRTRQHPAPSPLSGHSAKKLNLHGALDVDSMSD